MLILGMDTSGKYASCALLEGEQMLGEISICTKRTHSQIILPMAKKLIEDCGKSIGDIDGFAVVTGPGSYTGLRIGIGAVKGLCLGSGKPCSGVSALEAVACNFRGSQSIVCALMHARQELYYTAFFRAERSGKVVRLCPDKISSLTKLAAEIREWAFGGNAVICAGDDCEKIAAAASLKTTENITEEIPEEAGIYPAPPNMCRPSPSGICIIAEAMGFHDPEELNADYMQITKAEKDLQAKA